MASNKNCTAADANPQTPATEETLMLKSFLLFAAVVLLVVAAASAPARSPQESSQAAAGKKPTADTMAKARKVYELDCAMCHGAAGDGKTDIAKEMSLTLMDWTDPKSLAGKTDQQLFDEIRKGSGKMPPEDKARAKDDEVTGLVQYIRKFAKEGSPSAAPAAAPAEAPAPASAPAQSPSL